jgi:hypothetical protein
MFDRSLLPPVERLAPNGMRVGISASEQDLHFFVDFKPLPHGCLLSYRGTADEKVLSCERVEVDYTLIDIRDNRPVVRSTHRFEVPEADFGSANEAFNAAAESWPGDVDTAIVGGTWVEVEQFVDGMLRSASTNLPTPSAPTSVLLTHVHRLLLAYAPAGTVPRSSVFAAEEAAEYPCIGAEMNTPDPDGFGVGTDACGRSRQNGTVGAGPQAERRDK